LNTLGTIARRQGHQDQARDHFEEMIRLGLPPEVGYMEPYTYGQLGMVVLDLGDMARAVILTEQALEHFRRRNDRWDMQSTLAQLSRIARVRGERERAANLTRETLSINRTIGSRPPIASALVRLGWAARLDGDPLRAARLAGAAQSIRETLGLPLISWEGEDVESEVAALRSVLGELAFTAAWNEGRALTTDQAIKYALEEIALDAPTR
jgi:tetratricopeptide (TPR) repeat protein